MTESLRHTGSYVYDAYPCPNLSWKQSGRNVCQWCSTPLTDIPATLFRAKNLWYKRYYSTLLNNTFYTIDFSRESLMFALTTGCEKLQLSSSVSRSASMPLRLVIKILRPEQCGIFKLILLTEMLCITIQIILKFYPWVQFTMSQHRFRS